MNNENNLDTIKEEEKKEEEQNEEEQNEKEPNEEELNEEEIEKTEQERKEQELINQDILSKVFFERYKCIKRLGIGSFGMTYKAEYNNQYYALKFELKKNSLNLLENEAAIMAHLKGPNIPLIKSYGISGEYNILVMQLLGKNLEEILNNKKKRRFSLKTVCMLATQMISILEYIHKKSIIHRDIKPKNFLMGLKDLSQYIYLLNFGLARKYRSISTLEQYPFNSEKKLTGTARYASINALKGLEQSRRDDLESLGYVLIYFLKGKLPWIGLKSKNREERNQKILHKKEEVSPSELCRSCPKEFEKFIKYSRKLDFTEDPNYEKYRKLFGNVMKRHQYNFDYIYDWTSKEDLNDRNFVKNGTELDKNNHFIKKPWNGKSHINFGENGENGIDIYYSNKDESLSERKKDKNNKCSCYLF